MYERSYMHRDTITHVAVARAVDFVITGMTTTVEMPWCCTPAYPVCIFHACLVHNTHTGSVDGHVKFWKKQAKGIEFAKHFRAHLGPVVGMLG